MPLPHDWHGSFCLGDDNNLVCNDRRCSVDRMNVVVAKELDNEMLGISDSSSETREVDHGRVHTCTYVGGDVACVAAE